MMTSPRWIRGAASFAGGLSVGELILVVRPVDTPWPFGWFAILVGIAVAGMIQLALSTRRKGGAGLAVLGLSIAGGGLFALAFVGSVMLVGREPSLVDLVAMLVICMLLGGGVGFVLGIPLGMLASAVETKLDRRSPYGEALALGAVGVYLVCASALFTLYGAAQGTDAAGWMGAADALFVGLVLAALAQRNLVRIGRWVARARRGEIPGMRVRALREEGDEDLPILGDGREVLETASPGLGGAYRQAPYIAVARV